VFRTDVPASAERRCTSCGDEGVISGWEAAPFDLRPRHLDQRSGDRVRVDITAEVAATLRGLTLVDTDSERLVFRAQVVNEGIVLVGNGDELDELIGYVAAEANHEGDRRRQKRLDTAFAVLNDALNQVENW
jgi:hypothetical protein